MKYNKNTLQIKEDNSLIKYADKFSKYLRNILYFGIKTKLNLENNIKNVNNLKINIHNIIQLITGICDLRININEGLKTFKYPYKILLNLLEYKDEFKDKLKIKLEISTNIEYKN